MYLGTSVLNSTSINNYTEELHIWGDALTQDGDILFYSFHNDCREWNNAANLNGYWSTIATIPPGTLNAGNYHIGICAALNDTKWLCKDVDVSTIAVDLSIPNDKLKGSRPGRIAPMIRWNRE